MSRPGKSNAFDAVRSALEENIVSALAQSGYYHTTKAGLGSQVDHLAKAQGKVWSALGLSALDEGLDAVVLAGTTHVGSN